MCTWRKSRLWQQKLLKVLGPLDPEDEGTMAVRNVIISNLNGLAIKKKISSSDCLLILKAMFVPA
jgi:hypothetical protein